MAPPQGFWPLAGTAMVQLPRQQQVQQHGDGSHSSHYFNTTNQQQQTRQKTHAHAPLHGGASWLVGGSSGPHQSYGLKPAVGAAPLSLLAGKPTLIQWGRLRFLIMDAPRDVNLGQYLREARAHNVTDLVRVCGASYSGREVEAAGIRLHEMSYEDGESPPPYIIDRWLALVDRVFFHAPSCATATAEQAMHESHSTIAVHCVHGLGRAPVLVALALIELGFGDAATVVGYIRSQRRGAINARQLAYLEQYQPRSAQCVSCSVM